MQRNEGRKEAAETQYQCQVPLVMDFPTVSNHARPALGAHHIERATCGQTKRWTVANQQLQLNRTSCRP